MDNPAPKRWRVFAMLGGGTALMSAIAAGFFQTIGAGLGTMVMPAAPVAAPTAAPGSEQPGADTAQPESPKPQPAAGQPSDAGIVRDRVRLDFGSTANGPSEAAACAKAAGQAMEQANRQCGAITAERRAAEFRLDEAERQCRSCGPAGGEWRCIAHVTPVCVVIGGVD